MPKIEYQNWNPTATSRIIVEEANDIIDEYLADGYDLTLRQLYYQFVARDLIQNNMKSYKRLGSILNNARMSGLVDWNAIIDRTRPVRSVTHWNDPSEIIEACASQFRIDTRDDQEFYIEVWIEKDALVGVVQRVAEDLDLKYLSCRGYVSQSSLWIAGQRMIRKEREGKKTVIVHLGDHDPSGIDMSRDIQDRLITFGSGCEVKRIALNRDQVDQYNPPPNPAKLTDSRCGGYIREHGEMSWELDALDPRTITALIREAVDNMTDQTCLKRKQELQRTMKSDLQLVSDLWDDVIRFVRTED